MKSFLRPIAAIAMAGAAALAVGVGRRRRRSTQGICSEQLRCTSTRPTASRTSSV